VARAASQGAQTYEELLRRAEDDAAILALWLGGSRGMGRPTEHSDWDIWLVAADDAIERLRAELGVAGLAQMAWRPGVDLILTTMGELERLDVTASNTNGRSHMFAHLNALVDKTGEAQRLIDAKARIPAGEIAGVIHAALDHALNQAYRALKCLRDGDAGASRLEAAEGVNPFFDAVFALHDGRLRPYYKYLRWELETWPLTQLPDGGPALMDRALSVLGLDGGAGLSALLAETHAAFRAAGHGAAYDGWGEVLDWILTGRSDATP
jgi:hypothetical protein